MDSFSFCVYPRFSSERFECSFETRPDDPGTPYMRATIRNGNIDYFFYGAIPEPPYEALQEIVEKYHLAAWNGYNEFLSSDESDKSFSLSVQYESGESIFANGSLLPEHYEEVENELVQVIWSYIQEHKDEFADWQ